MNPANRDFRELYRAAFAERDPEKKLLLLSQVQEVVKPWEHDEVRMTGQSNAQAQTSSASSPAGCRTESTPAFWPNPQAA